jgi:fatty-acyl-CoA synthase
MSTPSSFNFADLFEALADAGPDRPCLVAPPVRRTFGELDERATRLANHLSGIGVGAGDHVAIHAMNRAEWIEAMFACFKLRAVPINVNYRYVEAELTYLYENSDCRAVVAEAEFVDRIEAIRPALPRLGPVLAMGTEYEDAVRAASPERRFGPRRNDDLYIVYTGGTTGMPKGVMWRHEDAFFALAGGGRIGAPPITGPEEIVENATRPQIRLMATTPIMHGGAQWLCFYAIFSGGTAVISTLRSYDPKAVLELAEQEKVNSIQVIGDAMGRPLAEALRDGHYDLANLYTIGNGGAPLTAAVKDELRDALPGVKINDSYGASETGAAGTSLTSDGGPTRFAVSPQVTVLGDDLRPVAAGSGIVGKLARSGHIPLGYYKDPDKTAATFPVVDGRRWVVPGDFATLEADGSVALLGRGSVSINSGGEKIYPEEVEAALRRHPAVYDAVVCGVPSPRWGEEVVALVQARDGTEPGVDELRTFARTLVADYKVPKRIFVVAEVRHTPVGKQDYVWAKETAVALTSS